MITGLDTMASFGDIPDELLFCIFRFLKREELGQVGQVCRRWRDLTRDSVLLKYLVPNGASVCLDELVKYGAAWLQHVPFIHLILEDYTGMPAIPIYPNLTNADVFCCGNSPDDSGPLVERAFGLYALAGAPLRNLYLRCSHMDLSPIEHLLQFTQLEKLDMSYCDLQYEDIVLITELKSLTELRLNNNAIDGISFAELAKLPILQTLYFEDNLAQKWDVLNIPRFPALKFVSLFDTHVSEKFLFPFMALNRQFALDKVVVGLFSQGHMRVYNRLSIYLSKNGEEPVIVSERDRSPVELRL